MGDKLSKDFNIVNEYSSLPGMPVIGDYDFDVELEKQCFMSINVIRNNPRKFLPHFEHALELKGGYKGKKGKKFIAWLKKLPADESLPPLGLDTDAMKACRLNNEALKMVTTSEGIPLNGNQIQLQNLVSGTKQNEIVEFTYWSEWKHSAHELILTNILVDFERHDRSIMLDHKTMRCGFSYAGHPTFGNMFQSVYLLQKSNSLM